MSYNDNDWAKQRAEEDALSAERERQELLKAKAQRAIEVAKQEKAKRQKPKETPAQAAATAERQPKDEGFMSKVGNLVQDVISGDAMDYALDAVAGAANDITPDNWITKPLTEGADEFFKTPQEKEAILTKAEERRSDSSNPLVRAGNTTTNALEGVSKGMEAGLMMPATIAARLLNQEASWSNAPAQLKDSPVGQTIFEITQVLTPTLLTAGVGAGLGMAPAATGGTALVAESALETAPQDSAEDLVAGRFLAQKMGDLADHLGYDGAQLTRDLIEGKEVNSQVFVAAAGLFQNLGFNWGANKLFTAIGNKLGTIPIYNKGLDTSVSKTAKVLSKNEQAVAKALDDTNTPPYSPNKEPHDVESIDNAVPVGKPSQGKTFISDENLVAESLRKSGLGEDGLTAADRNYFTNWGAISDSAGVQKALQEATKTLKRLKDYPDDLKGALGRATKWWNTNKRLIDENLDVATLNFANQMVEPLKQKEGVMLMTSPPIDAVLREYTAVSEEGFIAAALMGEELGVRIQKLARQAINLESAADPIDFTKTIENLLELQDKANLFLIPLRRGKRKWAVEGTLQQRKSIKGIRDADVQGAIKKADPVKYDAPARSFETQKLDDNDTGFTIRELWERYKGGDDGAGQTLKTYLTAIAYSDPSNAVSQVENLTSLLYDQLKNGRSDAVSNLFYGFMLSRVATQTASASSNIARVVGEPIGAIVSGEWAYGFGQLMGGLSHAYDGLKMGAQAFKENRSLVGGAKLDASVYDLKLKQTKLDEVFKGVKQELAANPDWRKSWAANIHYWGQTLANNPVISTGNRFLLAQDEAAKVIFGAQVATGRAYKEAVEIGLWKSPKDVERLVSQQFRNVFKDGIATGKIIDADVLAGAKQLTFQSDIPVGNDANFIDNAFSGIADAANSSAFWKFFSPFTRVSYNILETAGRYEPTGMFRTLAPRYKAILAGEMGDVAQLQLKSQIALGWLTLTSMTGLATFGLTTGYNSGSMPKTSFIIPDGKGGYTALPYNKLEPYATIIAVVSDAVNGLRDDVISQGQYDRFMAEMMYSIGMATFDKGFLSGMNNLVSMLDVKNFGEGTANGLANSAGIVSPALVRMLADWVNPHQSLTTDIGNIQSSLWAKFKQRTIGGSGNPVMYNELTGKAIPKVATFSKGDDWNEAVWGSILNEFVWAGKVKGGTIDPIVKKLDELDFKVDNASSFRTFEGIPLSLEQQSKMSKAMNDVGNLRGRLEAYFATNEFKDKQRKYKTFRWDNSLGNQGDGTRANAYLQAIHADIRSIRRSAKEEAAKLLLRNDPDFARKYQAAKSQMVPQQQGNPPEWQGLLNWAR